MKYNNLVKPGHYLLKKGMSNMVLVRKLRAGNQDPVTLRFESKRTIKDLAQVISSQLEMDESAFLEACFRSDFLQKNNLTKETLIAIFIPNTYKVYWNIKPEKLLDFFVEEHKKFFVKHQSQLQQLGMTPIQVSILASIIEAETYQDAEKKRISGVYHNRLKQNMRLQADPTVIFAIGDFTKTRVLKSDLQIDSPYNTYKIKGLPIGPINAPGLASLEAALYPESHDFIFFCAKPDFSGYHDFSSDYQEHLKQARAYQQALNKLYTKN
ncbi:MAG: aminodeoxychorismate lyase [Bacteroidia bacterium]|nr:MAG: aminodeoxychorismate lyase [Bacteroidia bacterium]